MRIKGKYVGTVTIHYDADLDNPGMATLEEVKENLKGLSHAIKTVIYEEIIGEENGTVEIVEMVNAIKPVAE